MEEGLGFDDVLIVPKKSIVKSRKETDTSTILAKDLTIKIPIISANMVNVTEHKMAIAMAREGGIGIIHRFMPINEQVEEVKKVKRAENIVIDEPYTIKKTKTVKEAKEKMKNLNVNGLIVEENGKLIGIITKRDVLVSDENEKVENVMTKKKDLIFANYGISIDEAFKIFKKHKIEKLPLVDKKGFIKGLITLKDLLSLKMHPNASKDKKGRLMVGAAIGIKDWYERTKALIECETDVIVLDIAHGHSEQAIKVIKEIRKEFGDKICLIAGNVATGEGTSDLINAGSDAIKVGIGSGSICITRIVTGCGVPQITALLECSKVAKKENIPLIADGGIKNSGDIVKAIGAGASSV
ncbi:MAG: IMP dehydrogenase, partial [Candidatus Aenigmatarchaeota archaeon]